MADFPDLKIDVDVNLELYTDDVDKYFKDVNYNGQDTPQEDLYSFPFEMDLRFTELVADDRQFKIEIGKIYANVVSGVNLKGDPAAIVQNLSGIAAKPAAGDNVKITIKNDISTNVVAGS